MAKTCVTFESEQYERVVTAIIILKSWSPCSFCVCLGLHKAPVGYSSWWAFDGWFQSVVVHAGVMPVGKGS